MKPTKVIPCPEYLGSSNQQFVKAVSRLGAEYIAELPYLGNGYKVLITKEAFEEIQKIWKEELTALLEVSSGSPIRNSDNVMLPRSIHVSSEDHQL